MHPLSNPLSSPAQDSLITATVVRERARLAAFIRRRVPDAGEAEDILQDVFYELVQAWRLPEPIEQVGAWLFQVARNRIIDRFRKKKELPLAELAGDGDDQDEHAGHWLAQALPAPSADPQAAYARSVLVHALQDALEELPRDQREVFLAHELEGRSFREMARATGTSVNTLLARKRYAVLHLRKRLAALYGETDF